MYESLVYQILSVLPILLFLMCDVVYLVTSFACRVVFACRIVILHAELFLLVALSMYGTIYQILSILLILLKLLFLKDALELLILVSFNV